MLLLDKQSLQKFLCPQAAKFSEISRSLQQSIKKDKLDAFAYQPEVVGPKTAFFTLAHDMNISRAPISLKCIMKKEIVWTTHVFTNQDNIQLGTIMYYEKFIKPLLTKKEKKCVANNVSILFPIRLHNKIIIKNCTRGFQTY